MNTLDVYTHKHSGSRSQANVGSQYAGYHLVQIHSVSMYFTFKNVTGTATQRTLVITDLADQIVLPEGAYSLNSLNKVLSDNAGVVGPFVKIAISRDGVSGYQIRKYASKADMQSDTNGIVQSTVSNASPLNIRLASKTLFCERIKLWSSIVRAGLNGTVDGSGMTQFSNWIFLPVQCEPGSHQLFSYHVPLGFEWVENSVLYFYFTDEMDNILEFPTDTPAYLTLDFQEGKHSTVLSR